MDDTTNTNPPPEEMDPDNMPPAQEVPLVEPELLEEELENQDELFERSGPANATGPGKVIAFGAILLVVVGFILYTLFFDKPVPTDPTGGLNAAGGLGNAPQLNVPLPPEPSGDVGGAPALPPPAPAPISAPPPPPPPPPAPPAPPPPAAPALPVPTPATTGTTTTTAAPLPQLTGAPPPPPPPPSRNKNATIPAAPLAPGKALAPIAGTNDKNEQARIRSNMLVINGGTATSGADAANANSALNRGDANKQFTANVLAASSAEKKTATRLNNLGITLAQGKIIDAVLETAINTDLPGTIRAIVSRDVYAETGRDVMIPKGSRLLGTYNTGIQRGQVRVLIIWTRLIRPDGIDIEIGSPGVDALGRAGVEGNVDNKYSEIFSAAILTSALGIGVAVAVDKLSNQDSTTTSNSNGTTTSGGAAGPAGASAVANIGSIGSDIVNTLLDVKPTVTIDQGTRLNVFVNRDLTFPSPARSFIE